LKILIINQIEALSWICLYLFKPRTVSFHQQSCINTSSETSFQTEFIRQTDTLYYIWAGNQRGKVAFYVRQYLFTS